MSSISPEAKRLISFVKGIPADKHEELGKHFDATYNKALNKFKRDALIDAAIELKDLNIKSKADEKKEEQAKKEKGKERKIKTVKKKK